MRWLRPAVGILLFVTGPLTVPARAGVNAGLCLATIRFDFAGQISNNSPPTSYTMSGSGTCQTSAGLGQTIILSAAGQASSARCLTLVMKGPYTVDFFPEGPQGGGGSLDFAGTASGGVVVMRGSMPTFVGVAAAAGGGLLGCSNGTNSLTFSILLAFVDP